MKTLISVHGLESSKNFETKVSKLINEYFEFTRQSPAEEIYISDAGMKLAGGYGQYKEYVDIRIDGIDFQLKNHSTCAPDYDFFNNSEEANPVTYSNRLKGLILDVIYDNRGIIDERISEEREKQNLLKRIAEKETQLKKKIAEGEIDVSHLSDGPPELDRESEKIMRGEPRDVFLARRRSGLDHQGDPENL